MYNFKSFKQSNNLNQLAINEKFRINNVDLICNVVVNYSVHCTVKINKTCVSIYYKILYDTETAQKFNFNDFLKLSKLFKFIYLILRIFLTV